MKNRCLLFVALLVTMLCSGHRVVAQSVTIDGITYYVETYKNTAYVSDALDTITHAKVKAGIEYNGMVYPVTRIGDYAFQSKTSSLLQTVELPNSITEIGNYAFQGCNNLISINIPTKVTSIGSLAFFGCSKLTSIEIPSGVKVIQWNTFSGCSSLKSITLPDGLTSIEQYAFYYCLSLDSINIPSGVTEIGEDAFGGCTSLKSIVMPDNIQTLSDYVFRDCSSLQSVKLPDALLTIGGEVFSGCSSLETLSIPAGVAVIDPYAFYNCSKLSYIELPSGIKTIGSSAFCGCSSLSAIALPSGIKTIENSTFNGCSSLETLDIPSSVASIGSSAFYNCSNLSSINLPDGITEIKEETFRGCSSLDSLVIPSTVTTIGRLAFYESGLPTITLPANVTSVGYNAFPSRMARLTCEMQTPPTLEKNTSYGESDYSLGNISVVYVPQGCGANYKSVAPWASKVIVDGSGVALTVHVATAGTMGEEILNQTSYLSNVNYLTLTGTLNETDINNIKNSMPNLLTIDMAGLDMKGLPSDMFNNRKALLSIILPANVETIGYGAFYNCINLESMVLPEGLTTIEDNYSGNGAFQNCTSLKSVSFPSTLKKVGSYAFSGCSLLDNVTLKEGLTYIGENVFYSCRSLKNISLPKGVISIGGYAFAYCTSLKDIELKDGLTALGYYYEGESYSTSEKSVFLGCSSLEKVVFPSTLKTIGSYVFQSCSKLTTLIIPEGISTIGREAFSNCTSLKEVTLPSTLVRCANHPFRGCSKLEKVTCMALIPPSLYNGLLSLDDMGLALERTLYVPEWTLNKYKLTSGWAAFAEILPISGVFPTSINVQSEVTLALPNGGFPAGYKPDLSIEQGYNYNGMMHSNGAGNLYLKGSGDVSLGTFKMSQYKYDDNYSYSDGHSYWDMPTVFLNEPDVTADSVVTTLSLSSGIWYFLSFPYDVKVKDIVTNGDWVIRRYDGAARARAEYNNTWVTVPYDSVLHAGQGYIWSSSNGSFTVPAVDNANKNLIFANTTSYIPLAEYVSEYTSNNSWNLIGNPYPCYYDTRFMEYTAPITVWDRKNRTYVAYSPVDDSYILTPLEAFFVQRPADVTQAGFKPEGRQTSGAVRAISVPATAGARAIDAPRQVFNMQLSNGQRTDRTRFVINTDAQAVYEVGCDAAKFMSSDAQAPQLFTLEGADKMAINERPFGDGKVALGVYFGSAGTYTLSLESMVDMNVTLIDHLTGKEQDITNASYTFESEAGTFADRFTVVLTRTGATVIDETVADNEVKVYATDGGIAIVGVEDASIMLYTVSGAKVAETTGNDAQFNVQPGLYVVKVGNTSYKVSVNK